VPTLTYFHVCLRAKHGLSPPISADPSPARRAVHLCWQQQPPGLIYNSQAHDWRAAALTSQESWTSLQVRPPMTVRRANTGTMT
jgi:hypothetical protein